MFGYWRCDMKGYGICTYCSVSKQHAVYKSNCYLSHCFYQNSSFLLLLILILILLVFPLPLLSSFVSYFIHSFFLSLSLFFLSFFYSSFLSFILSFISLCVDGHIKWWKRWAGNNIKEEVRIIPSSSFPSIIDIIIIVTNIFIYPYN